MGAVGRVLSEDDLVVVLERFRDLLVEDEARLNALNVFPLADRDTGTNLVRTVSSLVERLHDEAGDPGPLGRRVGVAALESARGNSGLIASQYLSGLLADGPGAGRVGGEGGRGSPGPGPGPGRGRGPLDGGAPVLDGIWFGAALTRAATEARAAVAEPVEGTMITVGDRVAGAVADAVSSVPAATRAGGTSGPDLAGLATMALGAATVAVAATPSQLPVLADAGVVDAGGAGLALLFQALVDELASPPAPTAGPAVRHGDRPSSEPDEGAVPVGSTVVGYELQFTFDGPSEGADVVRRTLGRHGRDVVVTWAAGVGRAHVHLDGSELGPALEATVRVVEPRNIGVEPLVETTGP